MKDRRVLKAALAAIIAALIFGSCRYNNAERRIRRTVLNHQDELTEIAVNTLSGSKEDYKGILNEGIFESEDGYRIVQFYVTGFGLVPSASYEGFYYSPDDIPVSYQNAGYDLEQTAEDTWEWSDDTDNGGITKRITENWYYYKAWF